MKTDTPTPIHLKDYTPPEHLVDTVHLEIELAPETTQVRSVLSVRPNPDRTRRPTMLTLNGSGLDLKSVKIDGETLSGNRYRLTETDLTLFDVPAGPFTCEILTSCAPASNTSLLGLYLSNGIYCTQCEAEGFRRLTYYPDRPDVMATFTTRIVADKVAAPVLLSNGNLVASGDLEDGRHFAEWHDPFPKPSYLFAMVAGNLACVSGTFTTRSGRKVDLKIFVEPGNEDRCGYAMDSLKRAMRWDEETFGREYDLDIFMIVAVSAFNMGAMENKGLNIFNDKYVLVRADTATDMDFAAVESIVAHEYFHNWTGNRITCRDWFQLCLKEGLTVFRDQEFTSDMRSRPVKRISDVRTLRTHQFPEDGGPLAHPVRPGSYIEINNFYTATVYEKGAELVRMIHTLIGPEKFRAGMDLYFERHDGQAATVEEFLGALEDGSGRDLSQFRRWYSQAGTPEVLVSSKWNSAHKSFTLKLNQICLPTPGQPSKETLTIPVTVGLLDSQGREMPLQLAGESVPAGTSRVLELTEREQSFEFTNLSERPVPSILRNFSAPVKLSVNFSERDWVFLMTHDPDPFNRWEACQKYAMTLLINGVDAVRHGGTVRKGTAFADMVRSLLSDPSVDHEFMAQMITLPSEQTIGLAIGKDIDVEAIHLARHSLRQSIAEQLQKEFSDLYERLADSGDYSPDARSAGRRSLRNVCLGYLALLPEGADRVARQFDSATNMTDSIAALTLLSNMDVPQREPALAAFAAKWSADHLVMDKWFAIQAMSCLPDTLNRIKLLERHPGFLLTNPNKVRALIGSFANANQLRFHEADGSGYAYVAARAVELDRINPQVAARLLGAFKSWRQFDAGRRRLIEAELRDILSAPSLSRDAYEIVSKTLG